MHRVEGTVPSTMNKIASPRDLQRELSALLVYAGTKRPSQGRIAAALNELAAHVAPRVRLMTAKWKPTNPGEKRLTNELADNFSWMNEAIRYDVACATLEAVQKHDLRLWTMIWDLKGQLSMQVTWVLNWYRKNVNLV